jgi:hypothetical protein
MKLPLHAGKELCAKALPAIRHSKTKRMSLSMGVIVTNPVRILDIAHHKLANILIMIDLYLPRRSKVQSEGVYLDLARMTIRRAKYSAREDRSPHTGFWGWAYVEV